MFLTEQTVNVISASLKQKYGNAGRIEIIGAVSGGSINNCFKIKFDNAFFFVKVNSSQHFPNMFMAEAEGLKRIGSTNTIKVPQVVAVGNSGEEQFLVLEWIDQEKSDTQLQTKLGHLLAQLHRNTNDAFGLDHQNYMGSLVQTNNYHSSWATFYIQERLLPQVSLADQKGLLTPAILQQFESLYKKLKSFYTEEPPAFVHGDLWSGNYLIDHRQQPILIDPALSFSNREFDIAMTTLFGGFSPSFYDAYNEAFPLQNGWKQRLDLWNLYPLLIHVNLFGQSYLTQVKHILNKFS